MLRDTQTILVVDDDPLNLGMLERLLKRKFTVLTATDGKQALELLEREPVCLILTDQQMPGMSGIELLQKSRSIDEHIVRMLVTANRDSTTFIEALKLAGAVRVITKPWDPEKLMQTVCDTLEKHSVLTRNRQAFTSLHQANAKLNKFVKDR
jgi:response regulator RpfG family c-di-GMP phosphodiesterase